jgi:hypothetical protein
MNNERRERIRKIITALEALNNHLNDILSEEQNAFDAMPEGPQASERGDKAQEAISNLEAAALDDIISSLESATE